MPGNVLLLQGPMGPFFRHFAMDLERQGFMVHKINLNGGDAFFYRRRGAIPFTGSLDEWPDFLENMLAKLAIDRIYLFGDGRVYHFIARDLARRRGVRVFVFEEGYLRPDYITLEEEGVNGFSRINRDPGWYRDTPTQVEPATVRIGHTFAWVAVRAILYYLACRISRRYPNYIHHRPLKIWSEGSKWLLSGVRRLWFGFTERKLLKHLGGELAGRFFLVPLQVHCDMQLIHHSPYNGVQEFIEQLIDSFVRLAQEDAVLVFKHHPMDRGYRDYARIIRQLAYRHGIEKRVLYIHDLPLPILFKCARGTVVINSTVGLSSIFHGVPVKVMGDAIYNMPGLASQLPLEAFWRTPDTPDQALYNRFRAYLLANTQINGNFYKRLPTTANTLGVIWPQGWRERTSTNVVKPLLFELQHHFFEGLPKG